MSRYVLKKIFRHLTGEEILMQIEQDEFVNLEKQSFHLLVMVWRVEETAPLKIQVAL